MKSIFHMFFSFILVASICSSGWGIDNTGKCSEAGVIVPTLAILKGDELRKEEDRVLHMCPKGAPGHFVRGMRYEQKGETELAIAEYRKALAADKSFAEAHGNLGLLLLSKGIRDEAAMHLAVGLNGKPDPRYREGLAKLIHNENTDVKPEIPSEADPGGYIRQGDTYLLKRNYDKAIAAYQSALKESPGRADVLQKLADARMAAGQDEQAAEVYQQLLSEDGGNSDMRYSLGVLYERQGMLDAAEEQYCHVVRQTPVNGDARRHLADIYMLRGNFPRAIREYKELMAENNDNPLLHFKLARACEKDKKYQYAIAEYLETIRLAPGNLEARKELAALYVKKGMGEKAVEQYRTVLGLKRDDRSARNALIALYVKLRKYDELFALVKEEVEIFPDDPSSHFRLGVVYESRKKYDAAIAEYQKVLDLKSNYARALKGLGKIYLKLGDLEKSRKYLEAAKKANPKLIEASELLYNLHIEESRAAAAEKRAVNSLKKQGKQRRGKRADHRTRMRKKGRESRDTSVNKHSNRKHESAKKKRSNRKHPGGGRKSPAAKKKKGRGKNSNQHEK